MQRTHCNVNPQSVVDDDHKFPASSLYQPCRGLLPWKFFVFFLAPGSHTWWEHKRDDDD
jgi:hypothetical protein